MSDLGVENYGMSLMVTEHIDRSLDTSYNA